MSPYPLSKLLLMAMIPQKWLLWQNRAQLSKTQVSSHSYGSVTPAWRFAAQRTPYCLISGSRDVLVVSGRAVFKWLFIGNGWVAGAGRRPAGGEDRFHGASRPGAADWSRDRGHAGHSCRRRWPRLGSDVPLNQPRMAPSAGRFSRLTRRLHYSAGAREGGAEQNARHKSMEAEKALFR